MGFNFLNPPSRESMETHLGLQGPIGPDFYLNFSLVLSPPDEAKYLYSTDQGNTIKFRKDLKNLEKNSKTGSVAVKDGERLRSA